MKVRDVLCRVASGTQVVLYNVRCDLARSRFAMPSYVSDLDKFGFLDLDVYLIDPLYTLEGIPALAIVCK